MSLNGKLLDKDHLQYFWQQIKLKFATAAQGTKADSAVQTIKINSTTQTKTDGVVNLPAYPTKSSLGLGNVDNTSDLNKPISTAVAASQASQDAEIAVIANAGAKNLLEIIETSQTKNDVTFSINRDGSVSLKGTANSGTTFALNDQMMLQHGQYILSGIVPSNVYLTARSRSSTNYSVTRNNSEIRIDDDIFYVYIYIASGTTLDNVVINPMLRPAAITDPTFQPYALPNPTLTPAAIKAVDEGAKNLLRNTASSQVVGGVTFTVNADGTIIANGTKTNNDWLYLSTGNSLAAGTYVLSSGLAPQSDTSLRLLITTADSLGSAIMSAEGTRQAHIKQLTSDYTGLYYAIRISSGTTVNNIVFKPMLCTASDWAISQKFVPYCPTNWELYETKAEKTEIHDLLSNITSSTITAYVDNLDKGHYTSFVVNNNLPADAPVADNMFIEIYIYSASTALIRAFPTNTAYVHQVFQKAKISGTWRDWYKFTGTAVT
jgi:hypothetical protein